MSDDLVDGYLEAFDALLRERDVNVAREKRDLMRSLLRLMRARAGVRYPDRQEQSYLHSVTEAPRSGRQRSYLSDRAPALGRTRLVA